VNQPGTDQSAANERSYHVASERLHTFPPPPPMSTSESLSSGEHGLPRIETRCESNAASSGPRLVGMPPLGFGRVACERSCRGDPAWWAASDCAAGGFYAEEHGHSQAIERKGRWGSAEEVPGTAALNQGGKGQVVSMSCAPTAACVPVGTYTDKAGNRQWFTETERDGRWRSAAKVPSPALNEAEMDTVWCAPGGLCAAGGSFTDPSTGPEAWVMTETHGRWHAGLEVPGIAALNVESPHGDYVSVDTVSCASAGNCAAGGEYTATALQGAYGPTLQPFVVTETNGTRGAALEVPGIEAISPNLYAFGFTTVMTCPSAGNCAAAGRYAGRTPMCATRSARGHSW
jgi:hypothetical protein